MARRLSWQIWADFGQARDAQNGGKIAQLGGKMGPRWRQDGPRWGLSGHLVADWGVILAILGRLGGDLCRNGRSVKMSVTMVLWLQIGGSGGLVVDSWVLFWAIVAAS